MPTRLAALCLLLAACGSHHSAPPPPPPPARAAPATPPRAVAPRPAPSGAGLTSRPLSPLTVSGRARLHDFAAALHEGRHAAGEGRQDDAIAAFRRALADAEDPRARCELGWALFLAGQVDDARRTLDQALGGLQDARVPARRRTTFAACLYNRGRVAQTAGDVAGAADDYRRSIALRPNATVQAALDALGAPPAPPAPAASCLQISAGPLATREALRSALQARIAAYHLTQGLEAEDDAASVAWGPAAAAAGILSGTGNDHGENSGEHAAVPSGPWLEAHIEGFYAGQSESAPERSLAVVEVRLASGWSGCVVAECDGEMNEEMVVDYDDALVVRGDELAARPRVYEYDPEGASDCGQCMDSSGNCDRTCNYESFTVEERVLTLRDGVLVAPSDACLLNEPQRPD